MSSIAKYVLENPDSVKEMSKDMRRWIKKAATDTVNAVAFQARKNIAERVEKEFIMRDKFLTSGNALFVTKPPFGHAESLKDIKASVGFSEAASFMQRQDEGGEHSAEKGKRLRIYTDKAREGGTKRGKVQRGYGYTVNARKMIIPLITKGISHKAKQVRRAAIAFKSGMLMYFNRSLFRITSFKSKGDEVSFEKEMIINRKYESTYTPAHNFFMPECEKAARDMQKMFNEAMDRDMDNH
jgi:hypothetical protein